MTSYVCKGCGKPLFDRKKAHLHLRRCSDVCVVPLSDIPEDEGLGGQADVEIGKLPEEVSSAE